MKCCTNDIDALHFEQIIVPGTLSNPHALAFLDKERYIVVLITFIEDRLHEHYISGVLFDGFLHASNAVM